MISPWLIWVLEKKEKARLQRIADQERPQLQIPTYEAPPHDPQPVNSPTAS